MPPDNDEEITPPVPDDDEGTPNEGEETPSSPAADI